MMIMGDKNIMMMMMMIMLVVDIDLIFDEDGDYNI